ncbi:putative Cyclin-dependent kinase inhibitor 5 [Cocos nucifera]|uniref:Putative Cyclin-dependent kinase inhibitor 5 n=1 Tax=Cocos nucifera TaxID=13894 RepID=A0A8K0IIZ8_COCNU|nr:putative Cyclin-dependent kinase inhibitor 5 [Cocos nucifera]
MGKDTRKGKITGEVAVMEVPNQSSVGVRTRAKTLALQRLQKPTVDPTSYLELRSRRLEKPFVATAARAKEACKEKPSPNPKSSPNASSKGSTSPVGQLAEGPVNSGSAGSVSVRSCCSKKGDASRDIEVSSRDNFLEPESGRWVLF